MELETLIKIICVTLLILINTVIIRILHLTRRIYQNHKTRKLISNREKELQENMNKQNLAGQFVSNKNYENLMKIIKTFDCNIVHKNLCMNILHFACMKGDHISVQIILKYAKFVDVNAQTFNTSKGTLTPLMICCNGSTLGHYFCLTTLVKHKDIKINLYDISKCRTALQVATIRGSKHIVKYLLRHGANPYLICNNHPIYEYMKVNKKLQGIIPYFYEYGHKKMQ